MRDTKAALIVASNREERGHMRIVARQDGRREGRREGGKEAANVSCKCSLGELKKNVIAVLSEDNEQQVTAGGWIFFLSF